MKAAQFSNYGAPEVIEINEVEKPTPGEKLVLIEVHSAAINPFDYKLRRGYMKEMMPLKLPITLGGDFSGVVVGEGREVFGQSYAFGGGSGAIAQYLVANLDNIADKPKSINHIEAGSLPLVKVSAIQALEQHMGLVKGPASAEASAGKQKILIHGGVGGIGSIAIQLAKHMGAYVATTVSSEDVEFVKNLGADEVIDYKSRDFSEMLKDYDAVFDTIGGDTQERSFKVLKKGGVLVSMLGVPSEELAKEYGVKVVGQNTQTNSKNLSRLAELVDQGAIRPQVDKVFPLEQTREAFEYAETGHPKGKVVISIKET